MSDEIGLCRNCRYCRPVRGARNTFYLCGRSQGDPRFPRYPRLPVLRCPGYEPEEREVVEAKAV